MNIQNAILSRLDIKTHGLIEVICELVEGSTEIDYDDVADAIKSNPTMMAVLEQEFKTRNMMAKDAEDINLTELFKDL